MRPTSPATSLSARTWIGGAMLMLAVLAAGCASLPSEVRRPPSVARAADAASPVVRVVAEAALPPGKTGVWPMPASAFALDARVALIRNATSSLDLQYYHIANDEVGQLVFRELELAAQRGVRVRLLVDDMHTAGLDPLLVGLAATPNAEVRLFNPFPWGRSSEGARYAAMLADFSRLNHRMHNKLFVADGAMAVVGGRNLADEYFFRSSTGNFLDVDFVVVGDLTRQLATLFDNYWNSTRAYPAQAIIQAPGAAAPVRPARAGAGVVAAGAVDPLGQPSLSAVFEGHARAPFITAEAFADADRPDKAAMPTDEPRRTSDTLNAKFVRLVGTAQHEVLLFSPYFIPGSRGLAQLKGLRARDVQVRVVTNSLATSDEPLVNVGYLRYRDDMLAMGVRLFELSDEGLKRDRTLRDAFGNSRAQLHAKLGFVDGRTVLAGSMNLDSRSAFANTEIGVVFHSPELAQRLLGFLQFEKTPGVVEVRRKAGGQGKEWVTRDGERETVSDTDPEGSWYRKVLFMMQSLFIPEELL